MDAIEVRSFILSLFVSVGNYLAAWSETFQPIYCETYCHIKNEIFNDISHVNMYRTDHYKNSVTSKRSLIVNLFELRSNPLSTHAPYYRFFGHLPP